MSQVATIKLMTEADAWNFLETTLKGKIPIEADLFQLSIGNWPVLHLKLEGEKFHSSITSKMMTAFLDLQKNIYRTYAKMQYDLGNGRLLTNDEKAALELVVEVNPGSSEYFAKFEELGKKLVEGAIHKMEGRHFVILGVVGLLCWSSTTVINGYIASQVDAKKSEVQLALSKEESRRLEIMKEAGRQVPYVNVSREMSEEVINKMFKGAVSANSISIGGHKYTKQQVVEIVRPERTISNETRLDGTYRILKVDSSKADFFKVELQGENGKRFWAVLQDATVTKERNKELLQEAEWSKSPIDLMINGREVKGEISSAAILDVKARYAANN